MTVRIIMNFRTPVVIIQGRCREHGHNIADCYNAEICRLLLFLETSI
jgi:hypothetical protein